MAGFSPFFSVRIIHRFYRDAPARDLSFIPFAETGRLMHNAGLLMRENPDGITLFRSEERTDALLAYAGDESAPLALYFKLIATSPLFGNFTRLPERASGQGAVLRSGRGPGKDKVFSLTAGSALGPEDLGDLTAFVPRLSKAEMLHPPVCLISIVPGGDLPVPEFRTYEIAFERKRAVWQYLFLGHWAGMDLVVSDLAGQVGFSNRGTTWLPGGRKALVVESDVPLPLGPEGDLKFQLRMRNGGSERVVLPRLPTAPLDPVGIRKGPDTAFISKIFVNP